MPLPHQIFWSYLAEDLIKIGRTDEAGRYLTRVLNEAPDAPQHGLLDEAERCFQQAAEREPDNYLPRYSLGKDRASAAPTGGGPAAFGGGPAACTPAG